MALEDEVGLGGLELSIDLSKQTAESWDKLWDSAIGASTGQWQSLVALGLTLALFSIIYLALTTGREIIEKQSWGDLVNLFIWPLVVMIFLGNNGALLAKSVIIIRSIGHAQVVKVLETQIAPDFSKFGTAINNVGMTNSGREAIDRLYQECRNMTGEKLDACWENASAQTDGIIKAAESRSGGRLQDLRTYAASVANAVNRQVTSSEIEAAQSFANPMTALNPILIGIVQVILLAMQWAFVNMLEASLILTGLFAPIAMGLSLLPLQGRPIVAWLVGFISLFGIQLGYNIVVGLVATVIEQAGATTSSDIAFMLFLGLFAPLLSTLVAGGGGVALYSGIQSSAKSIIQVSSDAFAYTTRQVVRNIDE
jgi:hypothetical protein